MNMDELITRSKEGDKEAIPKLYEKYEKLMWNMAWKYTNHGYDVEDIQTICKFAFFKAIRTYEMDRSEFSTYLAYCCQTDILLLYRRDNMKCRAGEKNVAHMQDVIGYGKYGDVLTLEDVLTNSVDYDANFNYDYTASIVKEVLGRFPVHHQKVISYCVMMEGRQQQAKDMFDLSQSRISRIIKKFREELDQELLKHGVIERSILEDFQGKKLGRPYRRKAS